MTSPDPRLQSEFDRDELDRLVRRALKAIVSGQEPPEHIWKRIKLELEKGQAPPRRFRTPWLTLAVQPAVALLLVMLGGIPMGQSGLAQTLLGSEYVRNSTHQPLPPVIKVYVEARSVPSSVSMSAEERDLYLLKTRQRFVSRSNAESEDGSPETSLLETTPLKAEPAPSPRPAKEGTLLKGGPYEK